MPIRRFIAAALAASLMVSSAIAAPNPPLATPVNLDIGALITNTLALAGTVNSADQTNTYWNGVVCVAQITASSGSPSANFKIQGKDAASASYTDYAQSTSLLGYAPSAIQVARVGVMVYPGQATTGLPANYTAASLHLPRTWRVQQLIQEGTGGTGKGPAMTGTLGCNYLL